MIPDLAAIQSRLREREAALQADNLQESELRVLAAESAEILHQLRAIRAAISPVLSQTEALLRQFTATNNEPTRKLDCRF